MLKLAVKNLFYRKVHLALSVLAITLAIVLILVIDGFAAGMFDQVTVIYREVDADLWVVQSEVEGIMTSMSSLPGNIRGEMPDVEGVYEVHETLSIPGR